MRLAGGKALPSQRMLVIFPLALCPLILGCQEREQPRRYEEGVVEAELAKIEQIEGADPFGGPATPTEERPPALNRKPADSPVELPDFLQDIEANPDAGPLDAGPPVPPPKRLREKKPSSEEAAVAERYPILGKGENGFLNVQTRPWCNVSVDGVFLKATPVFRQPLKPGVHLIKLENPEWRINKEYKVTVKPGQQVTIIKTLL